MFARVLLQFRNPTVNSTARGFVTQNPDVKRKKIAQLERTINSLNSELEALSGSLDLLMQADGNQDSREIINLQLTTKLRILSKQQQSKSEIERELNREPVSDDLDRKSSFRPMLG
jgi:TolA-binding protein